MSREETPYRAPLLPRLVARPPRGNVLVIAPHPDDEIVGPGGTLVHHARQGDAIRIVVVCSGIQGDPDGHYDRDGYTAIRESESRTAAGRHLGTRDLVFFGYPDGLDDEGLRTTFAGVPGNTPDEKRRVLIDGLASLLRSHIVETDARTIYYPWVGEFHCDHWACGRAILNLVANEPELMAGRSVMGYEVWTTLPPETIVDTTDTHDEKIAAIRAFASQLRYRDYATLVDGLNAHRGVLLERVERTHAEAFCGLYVGEAVSAGGGGQRR